MDAGRFSLVYRESVHARGPGSVYLTALESAKGGLKMGEPKHLIVSCDGGGIRGIVTTLLLQDLQTKVPNFLGSVDVFAGTSTGAIIALGLAGKVSIDTLVDLYKNPGNCGQIFPSGAATATLTQDKKDALRAVISRALMDIEAASDLSNWWSLLKEIIGQLVGPIYSNEGRKALLQQYLSNGTLADLPNKALVTTFQLNLKNAQGQPQWSPATFHNLTQNDSSATLVVDAAMCSSSAPLYFPPYQLPSGILCCDGGVFANNPSTIALGAFLSSNQLTPAGLSNVYLLSVGTGFNLSNFPYTPSDTTTDILAAIPYGILGWLWPESEDPVPPFPLLDVMFDGTSAINDDVSGMLLPGPNYRRANVSLRESHIALDNCAKIDTLVHKTQHYIKNNQSWQEIVEWAHTNFGD